MADFDNFDKLNKFTSGTDNSVPDKSDNFNNSDAQIGSNNNANNFDDLGKIYNKLKDRQQEKKQDASSKSKIALNALSGNWAEAGKEALKATGRKATKGAKKAYNGAKNFANDTGISDNESIFGDYISPLEKKLYIGALALFFLIYAITYWENRSIPDILFNHMDNQMYISQTEDAPENSSEYSYSTNKNIETFKENYDTAEEDIDNTNTVSPVYSGAEAYINGEEVIDEND